MYVMEILHKDLYPSRCLGKIEKIKTLPYAAGKYNLQGFIRKRATVNFSRP